MSYSLGTLAWEFTPRMHACRVNSALCKARIRIPKRCPRKKTSAAGCALGKASRLVRPCGSAAGARASPMPSASRCGSCTPRVAGVLQAVTKLPAFVLRQLEIRVDQCINSAQAHAHAGAAYVQGGDPLQLLPAAAAGLAAGVPGPATCAARHDGGYMCAVWVFALRR